MDDDVRAQLWRPSLRRIPMSEQPARGPVLIKRKGPVQRRTSVGSVEDSQGSDEESGDGTEEQHSPPVVPRSPASSAVVAATTTTTVTSPRPARVAGPRWVASQQPARQLTDDAAILVPASGARGWQLQAQENVLVNRLLGRFDQDLSDTVAAARAARSDGDGDTAKVALRKATRIAEGYAALTEAAASQWRAANNPAGARALPYAQAILTELSQARAGYRNKLHIDWPADYPTLAWQSLTQARISGEGATGVVFGYEGPAMKTVLKASADDPLGELLLANLLHQEISAAGTVTTLDVSIDRDVISGSVMSQLQPSPPNRTAADVATMKASFADPANTIFAFGVAAGSDLRTLAKNSRAALDNAMKNDPAQAPRFWKKLGRILVVDRFLGINDRLAPKGSNIGNIILGAVPDAITVIDNYDSNTQRGIRANPQVHTDLLDELAPAVAGDLARQIVSDVRRQVEWEALGSRPPQPQSSFEDPQLAGYLVQGIEEAIGLLVFKLVDSTTNSGAISNQVQRIRQADSESSRTGQPSPGLNWAAITTRAAYVKQIAPQ
jgi:hypothetical protein